MKRLQTTIQYETAAQKKRIEKAAKALKWGLGKFLVDAGDKQAVKILTSMQGSEQLTVESNPLTLNQ